MSQFVSTNIKPEGSICSTLKWNVCRACLCEDVKLLSLFNTSGPSNLMLYEIMISCTALEITTDDLLPEQICLLCIKQLCNSFNFKMMCEKSLKTLRQMQTKNLDAVPGLEMKAIDIKSELDMYTDPLQETSIITQGVEAILDDTIYKHDTFSNTEEEERNGLLTNEVNVVKKKKKKTFNRSMKIRKTSTRLITNLPTSKITPETDESEIQLRILKEDNENTKGDNTQKKRKNYSKKYICPECGKRFDSQKRLDSHRASMTHKRNQPGKTIKTCLRCRIYFEDPAEYLEHSKSHDIYLCSGCGHVCKSRSGYQAHMASHSNLQPHVCAECGKKYKSQSALQVHQRNHTGERRYSCEHCDDKFITWNSMKNHIRTHHTKERSHVCYVCSKAFTQSGSLNIHMRQHTGEKPYPCSECDMSFRSFGDRKCHMVKHTGERKYPCTVCSKRFARPYNLTQHMVTHTGERNYVCNICGRAFTQAHVLRGHMRTHPEIILQPETSQSHGLDINNHITPSNI